MATETHDAVAGACVDAGGSALGMPQLCADWIPNQIFWLLVTLVAIGFVAVWSVLSNVLCSIILLAARPFRVGQRVGLPPDDMEGVVEEVTLLHTVLRTDDGGRLKVPNNLFFQRVLQIRPPGYAPPPGDETPDAED